MITTDRYCGQRNSRTAIARVVFVGALIFAVIVAGSLSYFFFTSGRAIGNVHSSTSSVSCYKNNSCFVNEPVVDIIIPKLSQSLGSNEVGNNVLNVTRGESVSLTIFVYPTINLNATMELELFPPVTGSSASFDNFSSSSSTSTSSAGINADFNPSYMSISANGQASTVMTLNMSSAAETGVYSASASAVDINNPTFVWGTFFQINVQE
ncbi:MAG: hypothetical protein M1587_05805 [Thaumarchaeota archaeon]|nr:hypothetical protein [Nitrososphaerota archaeon]